MVLGIAKAVTKVAKLIGETKNLRVFAEQCDDGVKVLKSFDKESGELVKKITKFPKKSLFNSQIGNYAHRQTNVRMFSDGEEIKSTIIRHVDLPNNKKGHLSCHYKFTDDYCTDLYVFDPNINQKGLRAVKSQAVDIYENNSLVGESVSMTMYGGRLNGSVIKNMDSSEAKSVMRNLLKDDIVCDLALNELIIWS
ncbi:hypothetical protein J6A31_05265 [bacterium]|nr:hypothetical protein [bacterium]